MNEHGSKVSADTFDGDAISRADREFLASLSDHPLVRHPLYSAPPPPRPNYDGCTTVDDRTKAQEACFPAALDWMLVNYAYYAGAFMGKGGIISLVDGTMLTIVSMSGFMQPWMIVRRRPQGWAQEDDRRRRLDDASAAGAHRCRSNAVPTSHGRRSKMTA